MMSKLRCVLAVLVIFAFVAGSALTAEAKVVKVKIGHSDGAETPVNKAFLLFKKLCEEKSNGQFKVSVHPLEAIGPDREMIESTQVGTQEMMSACSGPIAAFVREVALMDIPFMFQTVEQARATLWSPDLYEFMDKAFSKTGLKLLGYYEQRFRNVTNSKRPIWKLEDLKGLKLRTMEAPLHMANFKALGASPTPMAWGEVFTSLQQGVIDGQENPFYVIEYMKFWEVQKYLSITNHIYDCVPIFANKRWFESLPADMQEIITDSIAEAVQHAYSLSGQADYDGLMTILASGMQVNAVKPDELARMKEVGQAGVMKELSKQLDASMIEWWVKSVDEAVAKARGEQ